MAGVLNAASSTRVTGDGTSIAASPDRERTAGLTHRHPTIHRALKT